MAVLEKGLVQVYTGSGKGKTTAAFGLIWRMLGWGGRVYLCQFLKPSDQNTGESAFARLISDSVDGKFRYDRLDNKWNMWSSAGNDLQVTQMKMAISDKLAQIREIAAGGKYDLIVLDEVNFCLDSGLADIDDIKAIILGRPDTCEIVLTGRNADTQIIEMADLVTEMKELKHPYSSGLEARKGIEY